MLLIPLRGVSSEVGGSGQRNSNDKVSQEHETKMDLEIGSKIIMTSQVRRRTEQRMHLWIVVTVIY